MTYLVEEDPQPPVESRMIPAGKARRRGRRQSELVQQIAEPPVNPRMEGFSATVQPGARKDDDDNPMMYAGEEIVVCTRGVKMFDLDGEEHRLGSCDTLLFGRYCPCVVQAFDQRRRRWSWSAPLNTAE
ncbi:MAG TPA: hypothetical protein VJL07_05180 [Dehalococcoidia bacterium]|nr:hypothetical protein [Dehalococcoidia bacterium]